MKPIRLFSEHMTSGNLKECQNIIDTIDILTLGKHTRGYYTLCIRYYINTNNIDKVKELIYSDTNLMKRDYLLYCTTIYSTNTDESIFVFVNYIIQKEQLMNTDIDILINNNCFELLRLLDGYYIECSKKQNCSNYDKLKRYNNINNDQKIIKYYQSLIPKDSYTRFIHKLHSADVILDGGNIFHYIKYGNYSNLETVLINSKKQFTNPMIIIHERHFKKNNPTAQKFYKKYYDNIFITPYDIYDDYYLILGMILFDIPVITNDFFRDHIFDMFQLFDSYNNQIRNYISEMLLKYNISSISNVIKISRCIQYNDLTIYIPCNKGFYSINI